MATSGDDERRVTLVPPALAEPESTAEPLSEPTAEPTPEPIPEPEEPPAAPDLFAAARQALARARSVRGVGEDPVRPVDPAAPMASAHAALERAREARRTREPTPERRLADALADAELRRLRRRLDGGDGTSDEDDPVG